MGIPHILLSYSVFQTVEYQGLDECYEQDLKFTIKKKNQREPDMVITGILIFLLKGLTKFRKLCF